MNAPQQPTPTLAPPFLQETAPYFLAACKRLAQIWDRWDEDDEDDWEDAIHDARNALVFAEGLLKPSRPPKEITLNKSKWSHLRSCIPEDFPSLEAAAPHLLAACRRLLRDWDDKKYVTSGVVEDAQIAILIAEGWV